MDLFAASGPDPNPTVHATGSGSGSTSTSTSTQQNPRGNRLLECAECGLNLTKQSHLTRHIHSHLPPTERNVFPCPSCGKKFSRQDVFTRHNRKVHNAKPSSKRNGQMSCFRCAQKKLKCDRGRPCATCAKAKACCTYSGEQRQQEQHQHQQQQQQHSPEERIHRPLEPPSLLSAQRGADPIGCSSLAAYASTQSVDQVESQQTNQASHTFGGDGQNRDVADGTSSPGRMINPSETRQNALFQNSFVDQFDSLSSFHIPDDFDFGQVGVDWLDVSENLTENWATSEDMALDENHFPNSQESQCSALPEDIAVLPAQINGNSSQLDTNGLVTADVGDPAPRDHDISRQQWPFDAERDAGRQRYQVPSIRQVLRIQIRTSDKEKSFFDDLSELFSGSYLSIPELDQSSLPTLQVVKRWVELYFREFHAVSPVIHAPTWDIETCPTILIAAMSLIGAASSATDGPSKERLAILSEVCTKMLPLIAASDTKNFQDINYLIAHCLGSIYFLGSGDRHLYQVADRGRGILIGSLRGLGILGSSFKVSLEGERKKDNLDASQNVRQGQIHQDWLSWRDQQQELRLAWTVFGFDYTLSTLTSKRGVIDLSELPTRMPCAESLWSAPSAQAWAALKTDINEDMAGMSVASSLRTVVSGKPLPLDMSPYSKRYCAMVLDRLLWDLKQLDMVFMAGCFGLPQSSPGQQERRAALLEILEKICQSLWRPRSTEELINHSMVYSIHHYSNLSNSGETMDLVVFIAKKSLSANRLHVGSAIKAAERRLGMSFTSDPQKTRSLLWHAAQIVGISNQYILCSPCEVLRIFAAYAFLIAHGRYHHRPRPDNSTNAVVDIARIYPNADQMAITAQWIQHGGSASVGSAEDIRSEEGIQALIREGSERLGNIITWRAAENFVRALQYFVRRDPTAVGI